MKSRPQYSSIVFALTMALLLLPLFQGITHFFNIRHLSGQFDETPKPECSFENYKTGKLQSQLEKYINSDYGFRELFIRTYNQYIWDFYDKEHVDHVIEGKEGWLFYKHHVDDYYGQEMYRWQDSREEAIEHYETEISRMNKLRGVLNKLGIEFLMFVAPDKAFIYPEYLPEQEFDTTTVNARKYYVKRLAETGFPIIDMTEWFIQMRDTASFYIMPPKGAHWNFSCVYGLDSLLRFMGDLKGEELPRLSVNNLHNIHNGKTKDERDIDLTLNLLRKDRIKKQFMTKEGDVAVLSDSSTVHPKVLFVGNSYLFQISDYVKMKDVFSDYDHWYYNIDSYIGKARICSLTEVNKLEEILSSDYVVWFADGCQIYKTSYHFVEDALIRLCVDNKDFFKAQKNAMDSLGLNSNEAYGKVILYPEYYFPQLRGDSIPNKLSDTALATLKSLKEKGDDNTELSEKNIKSVMIRIQNDAAWFRAVKKQAKDKGITIDEALRNNAIYVINLEMNDKQ